MRLLRTCVNTRVKKYWKQERRSKKKVVKAAKKKEFNPAESKAPNPSQ
jgi:hypothetical protein